MSLLLTLNDVSLSRSGRAVLEGVSLAIAAGQVIALCGPNGGGKSTLIKTACGLLKPDRGEVGLSGAPISDLSPAARAQRLAYLPQGRVITWGLPARDVAALGAPLLPANTALDRAEAALERVGMAALADRSVNSLSGGERARVLMARVLVTQAPLWLLDEPIADLDPDRQLLCLDLVAEHARQGGAVLLALHDLSLAARYAQGIALVASGRVAAVQAPRLALSQSVLAEVFGLEAAWVDSPTGPLLAASRRAPARASG